MRIAPIHLNFMLTCYFSPDPEKELGTEHWNSPAGLETREWLLKENLIDEQNRSTDRGIKWLDMLRETPLPIQLWVNPRKADA